MNCMHCLKFKLLKDRQTHGLTDQSTHKLDNSEDNLPKNKMFYCYYKLQYHLNTCVNEDILRSVNRRLVCGFVVVVVVGSLVEGFFLVHFYRFLFLDYFLIKFYLLNRTGAGTRISYFYIYFVLGRFHVN